MPGYLVEIRILGHLDAHAQRWFDGMSITSLPNGETLLSGPAADQSALFGLISHVRDLGLALVSVHCKES